MIQKPANWFVGQIYMIGTYVMDALKENIITGLCFLWNYRITLSNMTKMESHQTIFASFQIDLELPLFKMSACNSYYKYCP